MSSSHIIWKFVKFCIFCISFKTFAQPYMIIIVCQYYMSTDWVPSFMQRLQKHALSSTVILKWTKVTMKNWQQLVTFYHLPWSCTYFNVYLSSLCIYVLNHFPYDLVEWIYSAFHYFLFIASFLSYVKTQLPSSLSQQLQLWWKYEWTTRNLNVGIQLLCYSTHKCGYIIVYTH